MFAGMSTPPPEPGQDTPPSSGAQAAADAGTIAKGALTGGAAGAARAALKTSTGRNTLIAAAALPVIAACAVVGLVMNATSASNSYASSYENISNTAVVSEFGDPELLRKIKDISTRTGASWQVLAAIVKAEEGQGGKGPFGIDIGKAEGGITDADASDPVKSGMFIGAALERASQGTVNSLANSTLIAGAEEYLDANGNTALRLSADPHLKAAHGAVKKQYLAAIATLPIKGNPAVASRIFNLAQEWALGKKSTDGQCAAGSVSLGGTTSVSLNDSQKNYAQYIINAVAARGMPKKAAVIALATAYQESTLRMYWNPKVAGSEALAPDSTAEGTDGYSVGLFQQQVNGAAFSWGTVADAMNPTKSTNMFLDELARVAGWDSMAVTEAAQRVQRSAFPDAYAKWESLATQLVSDLKPTGGGGYSDGEPSDGPSPSPSASGTAGPTASPTATASAPSVKLIDSAGCTSGVGSGTAGKGDDYPFREPVGGCAWCIGGPDAVDPWTLYKRECVSFVAWRMNVQMGWKEGQDYPFTPAKLGLAGFGNAFEWKRNLAKAGYVTDNTPKVGAVAMWDSWVTTNSTITGENGHVAVVSSVNADGTITVEEYNFDPWRYGTRTIPASDVSGFIHVADIVETPSGSTASPTPSPSDEEGSLHD